MRHWEIETKWEHYKSINFVCLTTRPVLVTWGIWGGQCTSTSESVSTFSLFDFLFLTFLFPWVSNSGLVFFFFPIFSLFFGFWTFFNPFLLSCCILVQWDFFREYLWEFWFFQAYYLILIVEQLELPELLVLEVLVAFELHEAMDKSLGLKKALISKWSSLTTDIHDYSAHGCIAFDDGHESMDISLGIDMVVVLRWSTVTIEIQECLSQYTECMELDFEHESMERSLGLEIVLVLKW